jgi:hypothetical protein
MLQNSQRKEVKANLLTLMRREAVVKGRCPRGSNINKNAIFKKLRDIRI